MRSGFAPLAGFGAGNLVLAAVGVLVFGLDTQPALLFVGAGVGALTAAALAAWLGRPARRPLTGPEPVVLPDLSLATTLLAAGLALALVGVAAAGPAVAWPAAGLIALAVGNLVREALATRRLAGRLRAGGATDGAGHGARGAG